MKFLSFFFVLSLLSCQDKVQPVSKRPIEKVSSAEEELGIDRENFVLIPNVPGLKIAGENILRQNDFFVGENLKLIDASNDKTIDEYSLFDWGPVAFKTSGSSVEVYPVKNVLSITYKVENSKKVTRASQCDFKSKPELTQVDDLMVRLKADKADLEQLSGAIFDLAIQGDKKSYDFFRTPNSEQKKVLKNSDGAASIEPKLKVLDFMKANGCKW